MSAFLIYDLIFFLVSAVILLDVVGSFIVSFFSASVISLVAGVAAARLHMVVERE